MWLKDSREGGKRGSTDLDRPDRNLSLSRGSTTEAKEHHISVLHHIFLPLRPGETLLSSWLPPTHADEILIRDCFSPDKAFLEVRVYDTCCDRCLITPVHRPGPDLFLTGGEVALQAEQGVCSVCQAVESRLGQPQGLQKLASFLRGELGQLGLHLGGKGDYCGVLAVP